jgi:hypothetical protein
MSNSIDYFIVCHNQEFIIEFLDTQKFNMLPNYRFIFVGNGEINLIKKISNIIVCNKLPKNIEEYSNLCSFTAWYAITKNNLYTSNYLCLLEYDIACSPELHKHNMFAISQDIRTALYGYSKAPVNHRVFYRSTPILELALNETYNIDLLSFINNYGPQITYWLTTTNMMMHKNVLCSFVDWYFPMIEKFKHEPLSAYVHERAIHIFSLLNNIQLNYIKNSIRHHQKCSHNIEDVYGYFLKKKQEKCLISSDIPEYDLLYTNILCELDKKYNSSMIDHVNSKETGSK